MLIERYIARYGPVTLDDVAWWTGLGIRRCRDALHDLGTQIPVIVQTGQGGIETVVQAMRAGAFDFVVKPVSPERTSDSWPGIALATTGSPQAIASSTTLGMPS